MGVRGKVGPLGQVEAAKVRGIVSSATREVSTPPKLKAGSGAITVRSRAEFETLARRDNRPGIFGAREMKFVMTGVDTDNPTIYFVNTQKHPMHYLFATQGLGLNMSVAEFNGQTYFKDSRKFLAGSLVAHDAVPGPNGRKGTYALEFWPTDPVKAKHVAMAFEAIEKNMPFAKGNVQYHPAGDTQEALFKTEIAEYRRQGVKTITTQKLYENARFSALNAGEGYGTLRVWNGGAVGGPLSVRDVVIFKSLPNDLTHVAGVISEAPQTPLSHINLKAKQNNMPNAYVPGVSSDPKVAALIGKPVHYKVTADGYVIEPASQAQVDKWLEKARPKKPQTSKRDLSVTKIQKLEALGHADVTAYGAKAANVAELKKILPARAVPDGFAIPFSMYDTFMKATGTYEYAEKMMKEPKFKSDPAEREKALLKLQERIKDLPIPDALLKQLGELQKKFPEGKGIRMRSSTNNEDLVGFNGAGLYDSFTHNPDEGHIGKTVKQVWASLWNYRAFEEREFHRVDHLKAAMGILVHPNSKDELANGVAVTKNMYDPNWPGFYVNAQAGESLVTNPDVNAIPDEMLISAIGEHSEYETQFIRHSTLNHGKDVLTQAQVKTLVKYMERIQAHFKNVYGAENNVHFAMDIEFKVEKDGRVLVKQARPWVDSSTPITGN